MILSLKNLPIRRKLILIILGVCGIALLTMRGAFFTYEYYTFRQDLVRNITVLGEVIATNCTAALDFNNPEDAAAILQSLQAERHIVAAALYDLEGKLFARYPVDLAADRLPIAPLADGHQFTADHLDSFQSVQENKRRIGTLYIQSNQETIFEPIRRYAWFSLMVIVLVIGVAYFLTQILQRQISRPILTLTDTARAVSERHDFSVRAEKQSADELGLLTEAFNQMLDQIQQSDASLRTSEVRFRSLVTATAQIVWTADPDGNMVGPSPSWRAYTGQDEAAIQSDGWAAALHPEDAPRNLASWGKAVKTRTNFQVTSRIRRHDGAYRHFNVRGVPVLNEKGTIREWVGTCTDIHDYRIAEMERSHLAAIVKSAVDAILSRDLEGRILSWNHGATRMLGYTPDEVIGQNISLLFPPDRREEEITLLAQVNLGDTISQFETVRLRKDGTLVDVRVTVSPMKDESGRVVGASKILRDITEVKQIEAERDRFFTLSLDLLCIAGVDGYFRRLNPAFERTLGFSLNELVAQPFMDFVHPDDRAATQAVIASLARGEKLINFENRFRCKDGGYRWISWTCAPFPSEGLIYATGHDITGIKKTEAEINELNISLERRVEERTAQLALANKELESFSYSVSHDLRAPLRHIHGYVEMLTTATAGQLAEKPQRYLKVIASASNEMGQLIDDLLAFSRMSRVNLKLTACDMNGIVQDQILDLEMITKDRNITWKVDPLPAVLGDPATLRQVWANLIGNAIKYSRQRDPAIIEISSAPGEHGEVILFVRDNGAGFDMKYVGKLFGVFQRLHRSDEFEGTGIGLATVQRIITRHGGRVWAEGESGAGATFYFTLQPATATSSGA